MFNTGHVEAGQVISKKAKTNSQNSILLSYNETDRRKNLESYGGFDLDIKDGVIKTKSINLVSSAAQTLSDEELKSQVRYYIVQPGDSIYAIAHEFGVSETTIITENKLKGKLIKPNQELIILPVSGVRYTVKKGDTLASIAKKYDVDELDIKSFNNIVDDLKIGQKLIVPGGDKIIKKEVAAKAKKARAAKIAKARKYAGSIKTKTGKTYKRYSTKKVYGYWTHPVPGSFRVRGITSRHHGVDMAAPRGTPILAAASGTVTTTHRSGWNYGCGKGVVIKHNNGAKTVYCHASKVIVYEGQKVVQGQKIAEVGSTGNSTGNHLHFEVRGARNPF